MRSEAKLLDHVRDHIPDEEVLAAGWFEPLDRALLQSTSAGLAMMSGVGAGAFEVPTAATTVPDPATLTVAANVEAADEALAEAVEIPPAVILAVTPAKLYAFAADPVLATTTVKDLWKVWDRTAIDVHGSRVLMTLVISVEERASGLVMQWEGSKAHLAGPRHVLRELLTGD